MFIPGMLVVDTSRFPYHLQPWLHAIYVGTIVEPSDSIEEWNGYNSERTYCKTCGYVKVQYDWGIAYDKPEHLIAITPEQARMTPREKIAEFMGDEVLATYDKAMGKVHQ